MKRLIIGCSVALALWAVLLAAQSSESMVFMGPAVDNCATPKAGKTGVCLGASSVQVSINGGAWQPIGSGAVPPPSGGGIPNPLTCDLTLYWDKISYGTNSSTYKAVTLSNCH